MFDNNIKTEPIPERVYELSKLVAKGDIADKDAKSRLEPDALNSSSTTYYGSIREVCISDLKLIEKEGEVLKFVGDKKVIKDMESFRKYCNSIAFKDNSTFFYKIVQCYLEANDRWLKYKTLTDTNIIREVQDESGINLVTNVMMLGTRFWLSFLGFGYIQESNSIYFLPNMHIALQDYCEAVNFERNKEYTVAEFIEKLYEYSDVAFSKVKDSKRINLAASNALRQMHDNKEIVLKKNLDSKEVWELFPDNAHEFTSKITHIVYKGVKRG